MIDHLGLRTARFDTLLGFYEAALAPLGYKTLQRFDGAAGLGNEVADLWIGEGESGANVHLALRADRREVVDAFHKAALAAGAQDNGAPGLRPHYTPDYYGAFVIDPDGNNLEVVCYAGEAG